MQLRYDTGTLTASQSIELKTGEILPGQESEVIFSIPKELARQQADMDQLISELATAIEEGRDTEHVADAHEMSKLQPPKRPSGRNHDERATRRRPATTCGRTTSGT